VLKLILLVLIQTGSAQYLLPPEKTIEACQMRLSIDGRVVAEMRWALEFDKAKAHAQFTPNGTPKWYEETVRGWIDSAYESGDTPEAAKAWFEKEWEGCAGTTL
jgi:hypothetical protein